MTPKTYPTIQHSCKKHSTIYQQSVMKSSQENVTKILYISTVLGKCNFLANRNGRKYMSHEIKNTSQDTVFPYEVLHILSTACDLKNMKILLQNE